jgi:hypothetical protein
MDMYDIGASDLKELFDSDLDPVSVNDSWKIKLLVYCIIMSLNLNRSRNALSLFYLRDLIN